MAALISNKSVDISTISDLDYAIKMLENLKHEVDDFDKNCSYIINREKLKAQQNFDNAVAETNTLMIAKDGTIWGDDNEDVTVDVMKIPTGYEFTATGKDVAFLEFGTGVYHNGAGSYPEQLPIGISPIGGYGKGYGNRNQWAFVSNSGLKMLTHGNVTYSIVYYAKANIRRRIHFMIRKKFKV